MVACTPTQLLGAAALCVSALAPFAHGSSLNANPVSIVAEDAMLTHEHPAYGAAIPNEVAAYVVEEREIIDVSGKTNTTTLTRTRSRALEASSKDMLRLEDHFKTKMETNLKTMQSATYMQAVFAQAPWPSSYWPIYQDGINARWDAKQPSPADKYAMAFGLNVKQFADRISRNNGILSQSSRRACSETSECNSLKDGSICGKRAGEAKGYCIPGWFGICHAWAPAAILEKEPVCAVQRGNVTFQVFDIKALITQLYDGANMAVVFTGARYNGADEPADLDTFGRYKDDARRDLGPGFFHIAMTNIMGKFKQSLILDVTAGAAVWNQPVRSFKVLELKEVDVKQASERYFKSTVYPFNSEMKFLAFAKTKVSWIVEGVEDGPIVTNGRIDAYTHSATYEYLLELDANRNIIGGEWVGASRYEHPDFLWFPKGKPAANVVTNVGMKYKDIAQLLEDSIKCAPATPAPAPTTATPVTVTPVPSQCGTIQVGVAIYGDDLRQAYRGTQADCCALCRQTAGCKAYTYIGQDNWGGSSCFLKHGLGTSRPHSGAVSARFG